MTVSELIEWDREEGIINRAFTTQLVTMELIDLMERSSGNLKMQTIIEDLRLKDVDTIKRLG